MFTCTYQEIQIAVGIIGFAFLICLMIISHMKIRLENIEAENEILREKLKKAERSIVASTLRH